MYSLLECAQRKAVVVPFSVSFSGGVPTLNEGSSWLSIADTATGVVTFTIGGTLGQASARTPIIMSLTPIVASTGDCAIPVARAVTVSGFVVEISDDAGTLSDTDFHGTVMLFNSPDEV